MSLINQVLQDLDRRHASGAAMPAAVKTATVPTAPARAWRLAVIAGAVLLVAGGSAALAWSMASRSAQPAAASHAAAPAAVAAPAPTPVVVVTAPVVAAPAPMAAASTSTPAAAVVPPAAVVVAAAPAVAVPPAATPLKASSRAEVAAAAQEKAPRAAAPAETGAPAPAALPSTAVALAPTAAIKPSTPIVGTGESRIEKRTPGRTAHERAEGEYQRGVALHQAGQYAEAAQAYIAALHEESTLITARQALAGALINQGKAEDARAVLADGLAMAPLNMGLAMTLARLHVERGELQRAAEVLQPTDTASMSAEDHAFRAAVLQRINRHAEASDHFAAALRTAPGNGVWWMGLGISQAADGRNDTAKEAFNRARSSGSLTPELAQYVEQRLRQL